MSNEKFAYRKSTVPGERGYTVCRGGAWMEQDTDRGPSRPAAALPARERVGRSKAQAVEAAVARAKQVSARTIL